MFSSAWRAGSASCFDYELLTGLTTGLTYSVSVTAVDTNGNESASAIAQADSAITPTGTVSFGEVTVGSSAIRTFTVQGTGSGTIMGTASVPAPLQHRLRQSLRLRRDQRYDGSPVAGNIATALMRGR